MRRLQEEPTAKQPAFNTPAEQVSPEPQLSPAAEKLTLHQPDNNVSETAGKPAADVSAPAPIFAAGGVAAPPAAGDPAAAAADVAAAAALLLQAASAIPTEAPAAAAVAAAAAADPAPAGGWRRCSAREGSSGKRAAVERQLKRLIVSRAARASAAAAAAGEAVTAEAAAAAARTSRRQAPAGRVIPVYFHIVTFAGQGGVYMYQIDSQMAVLNSAFNRHGFTFTLAGAQTYRAASQSLYNAGPGSAAEFEIKRQLRMGGATDLNIFTWAPGDGLLGWATFPWDYKIGSPSSALDGVVVRTATLPGGTARDYNLGNTVVHEVGHWLGLYHTFTNGCNWGGDQIDDTPAEASAASGCPLWRDSCPGDGRRDPVQNYMDYSFDSCMNQFTAGQRARMWSAWDAYRQEKR